METKKQTKFITASKHYVKKHKGEVNTQEVITIPDQALSPKEILTLFVQGRQGEVPKFNASYSGDMSKDIPDISKMDKIEREEYARYLTDSIKNKRDEIKQREKELSEEKKYINDVQEYNKKMDILTKFDNKQKTPENA